MLTILDASTATAVAATSSQQAECEALIAPWGGGTVTARVVGSGGVIRDTLTLTPFTIDNISNPRRVICGDVSARVNSSTGDISKVVFVSAGTSVFEVDAGITGASSIVFDGNIKALCQPVFDNITFASRASSLPTGSFTSVNSLGTDANAPLTTTGQHFVLQLHASGGSTTTTGQRYSAVCPDLLADPDGGAFLFSTARGTAVGGFNVTLLRPVDNYGTYSGSGLRKESFWMGFMPTAGAPLQLITEARLDALLKWSEDNVPNVSPTRRYCTGGSMGAWGTMTYATRRPEKFAAIYPDRPRVRNNNTAGAINLPEWTTGNVSYNPSSSAPNINPRWRAGSSKDHLDLVAYVANTANRIPWIGWVIGSNDGFSVFSDHVALVAAMRSARRGFAFYWDDGNHDAGTRMNQIQASYPYGLFELGKGYPRFENHSGDQVPGVDVTGGINIGLTFRNVVESAGAWSCEVTSILGARTVDVSPISTVFTAPVAAQNISIPAANTWVPVSFTA